MKIAVTAATGNFGQAAVKILNENINPDNVVVIVRDIEKGKQLFSNNEVRQGNYDNKESMINSLKGIDRVLFISSQPGGVVPRSTAQKNVVDAMKANNIKFVAYTSFPNAQTSTSALAQDHRETENAIKDAGINHSFLRNNWYLENEIVFLQSGASNNDAIYWANNTAGWALEREYAEAAAKVVMMDNPKEVYELAGAPRSYEDLGHALQKATGNNFAIKQVTAKEYTKYLENAGTDHATAELFSSFQAPIEDGTLSEQSNDFEEALGHPLASIEDDLKEILAR